jgi:hypothetical protein
MGASSQRNLGYQANNECMGGIKRPFAPRYSENKNFLCAALELEKQSSSVYFAATLHSKRSS